MIIQDFQNALKSQQLKTWFNQNANSLLIGGRGQNSRENRITHEIAQSPKLRRKKSS